MSKKTAKRVRKGSDSNPKIKQGKSPEPTQVEEEKPFDFGGLPDRDLKKNLGCG